MLVANFATGVAGDFISVSAGLLTVPDGTPISGQTVNLDFQGAAPAASATTNALGIAQAQRTFAAAGTYPYSATFSNLADYFVDQNGSPIPSSAQSTVLATFATTNITASAPSEATVGGNVNLSATLTRASAPAGPVSGATIVFTIKQLPSGPTQTVTAITNPAGDAATSFSPSISGLYTVEASFAGTAGLGAVSTSTPNIRVYQPTTLSVNDTTGAATKPITVIAMLRSLPGNAPVAGQSVTFSFSGPGSPAPVTATTDASGMATTTVSFPTAATYGVTATFFNIAAFYTNSANLLQPTTATGSIVVTNTAPTLTVPANISLEATSAAGRTVSYSVLADDAEDGTLTATCAPPSGSVFAITTTTVTCSGTDAAMATTTATFTVDILDTTPPVLTVTAPAAVSATSASGAVVTYVDATAADLVDGNVTATCVPASGSTFPIGSTTVTCTATDANHNTGTATFVVEVTNNAPTFTAPANIVAEATGANGATVSFAPMGDDLEQGQIAAVCTPAAGVFAIGTTTVSCTVTDNAGESASGTFSVTVEDTTKPTVTVPTIAPAIAAGPNGNLITYTATASDIVDGSITPVCVPASGSTFPIGSTTVTCTATDAHNNTGTASFAVEVTNNAPTFTAPANIVAEATGANGATVSFAPMGNDVEQGQIAAVCTPAAGIFAIGTTTVNCTVTDNAGAFATGSFTVTVQDTTKPTLTLPTIAPAYATGATGRIVTYTATASDIVDSGLTPTCTPASGSTFAIGTTTVNCTVTDAHNNTTTGSFTVEVKNNAPTITVPANITATATSRNGAVVNFTASGNDVEDGARTAVCTPASGSTFAIGTTTVNCTVTDTRGATAQGSFTVTVNDVTTPGEMHGEGDLRDDDAKYEFEFMARENARGDERARISIHIDEEGRKKGKKKRNDRFDSRTVDFIAFSDDPTIRPGRPARPQIDTVTFSGVGDWNGQRNYRYEVFAQDGGEGRNHHESISVKIYSGDRSPGGDVPGRCGRRQHPVHPHPPLEHDTQDPPRRRSRLLRGFFFLTRTFLRLVPSQVGCSTRSAAS